MYSSTPYSLAEVLVEVPYLCLQSMIYSLLVYWWVSLPFLPLQGVGLPCSALWRAVPAPPPCWRTGGGSCSALGSRVGGAGCGFSGCVSLRSMCLRLF